MVVEREGKGKGEEAVAGRSGQDVPSDIVEINVSKSIIIGDEAEIEMSLAKEGERTQGEEEEVAEMVTVVEGLRDLSTLYGEDSHQDVYVIQALEDS